MAESVDALVSNTSGATHPGSIPGLGTKRKSRDAFPLLLYILSSKIMAHGSGGLTSKVWVQSQKDVYNSVCFKFVI